MLSCANTFLTPPLAVLLCLMPANSGARAGCPATMCINIHNRSRNDSNACLWTWPPPPPLLLLLLLLLLPPSLALGLTTPAAVPPTLRCAMRSTPSPCPSTTANCANNDRASCANPWNISANSHTRTCTRRNDIRSPLQSTIPGATVLNRMCIPYARAS
ncbi:hypothetical protein CFRS1_v016121 [Colletotrichum fructicola]|nr:hypothetical protein CFRS1_v016121 [Colletotrichum fructicola]